MSNAKSEQVITPDSERGRRLQHSSTLSSARRRTALSKLRAQQADRASAAKAELARQEAELARRQAALEAQELKDEAELCQPELELLE